MNKSTDEVKPTEEEQLLEIEDALTVNTDNRTSSESMINKRIDFDKKTFRRMDTMLPIYTQEIDGMSKSEKYSRIAQIAINALFEGDFKEKLEEL